MSEVEQDRVQDEQDETQLIENLTSVLDLLNYTPAELLAAEVPGDMWRDYVFATTAENYVLVAVIEGLLDDINGLIGVLEDIQVTPTLPGIQATVRETLDAHRLPEAEVAEMKQRLATYGGIDPTEWPDAAA